ncbi:MAG: hypothetical protein Fur0021_27030 [Candidatus Promineifilaceae bacterium]
MDDFISGLALARCFFAEAVHPILAADFLNLTCATHLTHGLMQSYPERCQRLTSWYAANLKNT